MMKRILIALTFGTLTSGLANADSFGGAGAPGGGGPTLSTSFTFCYMVGQNDEAIILQSGHTERLATGRLENVSLYFHTPILDRKNVRVYFSPKGRDVRRTPFQVLDAGRRGSDPANLNIFTVDNNVRHTLNIARVNNIEFVASGSLAYQNNSNETVILDVKVGRCKRVSTGSELALYGLEFTDAELDPIRN